MDKLDEQKDNKINNGDCDNKEIEKNDNPDEKVKDKIFDLIGLSFLKKYISSSALKGIIIACIPLLANMILYLYNLGKLSVYGLSDVYLTISQFDFSKLAIVVFAILMLVALYIVYNVLFNDLFNKVGFINNGVPIYGIFIIEFAVIEIIMYSIFPQRITLTLCLTIIIFNFINLIMYVFVLNNYNKLLLLLLEFILLFINLLFSMSYSLKAVYSRRVLVGIISVCIIVYLISIIILYRYARVKRLLRRIKKIIKYSEKLKVNINNSSEQNEKIDNVLKKLNHSLDNLEQHLGDGKQIIRELEVLKQEVNGLDKQLSFLIQELDSSKKLARQIKKIKKLLQHADKEKNYLGKLEKSQRVNRFQIFLLLIIVLSCFIGIYKTGRILEEERLTVSYIYYDENKEVLDNYGLNCDNESVRYQVLVQNKDEVVVSLDDIYSEIITLKREGLKIREIDKSDYIKLKTDKIKDNVKIRQVLKTPLSNNKEVFELNSKTEYKDYKAVVLMSINIDNEFIVNSNYDGTEHKHSFTIELPNSIENINDYSILKCATDQNEDKLKVEEIEIDSYKNNEIKFSAAESGLYLLIKQN